MPLRILSIEGILNGLYRSAGQPGLLKLSVPLPASFLEAPILNDSGEVVGLVNNTQSVEGSTGTFLTPVAIGLFIDSARDLLDQYLDSSEGRDDAL